MFNTSTCHLLPPLQLPCFSHHEMIPLDIPLVLPVDWPTTFTQVIHLPQNQANIIEVNSHARTHFVLVSHWHWNYMPTWGQSCYNWTPIFFLLSFLWLVMWSSCDHFCDVLFLWCSVMSIFLWPIVQVTPLSLWHLLFTLLYCSSLQ